jgi:hypothetical protein
LLQALTKVSNTKAIAKAIVFNLTFITFFQTNLNQQIKVVSHLR